MKKLTNAERLSILVSASCRDDLKDYFVDVKKVAEWVSHGDEWAIGWEYDSFETEAHPLDDVVKEVCSIFDMFRHLERCEANEVLNANLTLDLIRCDGFDANNDEHFGVAKVLVNDLERYSDVSGATTNSHSAASLPRYRRMLGRYEALIGRRKMESRFDPLLSEDLKELFSN